MTDLQTHIDAHKFETLLKEKVDAHVSVIELLRGVNPSGRAFYVYIQLKPSEYMDYKLKLEQNQAINPNDYEILEYGWGESPPRHVQEKIAEQYGADHAFEEKIQQLQEHKTQKIIG